MPSLGDNVALWSVIGGLAAGLVGTGIAWGTTTTKVETLEQLVRQMAVNVQKTREDVAHIRGKIDAIHP